LEEGPDEDEVTPARTAGVNFSGDSGSGDPLQGSEADNLLRHMSPSDQEPRPGDLDELPAERRFGRRALVAALAVGTGLAAAVAWIALPDHDAGVPRLLIHDSARSQPSPLVAPELEDPVVPPEPTVHQKPSPRATSREAGRVSVAPHRKQRPPRVEPEKPQQVHQSDPDSTLPPSIK
jgi:hypothetical protein